MGIGIGVAFTIIGIICLVGAIILVGRNNRRKRSMGQEGGSMIRLETVPSYSSNARDVMWKEELAADGVHEMDGKKPISLYEMPGDGGTLRHFL
jgi:hypothetical protein